MPLRYLRHGLECVPQKWLYPCQQTDGTIPGQAEPTSYGVSIVISAEPSEKEPKPITTSENKREQRTVKLMIIDFMNVISTLLKLKSYLTNFNKIFH